MTNNETLTALATEAAKAETVAFFSRGAAKARATKYARQCINVALELSRTGIDMTDDELLAELMA